MRYNTKLLHGGARQKNPSGATLPPVFLANAFEQDSFEQLEKVFHNKAAGFTYSRIDNPTVAEFEKKVTLTEEGIGSVACSSGMAAVFNAVMNILTTGDEIIASAGIFGGTLGLFEDMASFGVHTRYLEYVNGETIAKAVTDKTKAVFVETIANPRLDVADIREIADASHAHGLVCIVDNTAATSYLVRPLTLGADIVVQSSSKYINGSSNAISGIITDGGKFKWDAKRYPNLEPYRKMGPYAYLAKLRTGLYRNTGACLSPMNAYLNCIGMETLGLRMERICENALKLAQHLEKVESIGEVRYPGLVSNDSHEAAERQFQNGFGGILTLRLGSKGKAFSFINALKLVKKVSNIGDTKTLVIHPASTIYAHSTEEERLLAGVYDDLVRVSVGIEDIEDLTEDFDQAIKTAEGGN